MLVRIKLICALIAILLVPQFAMAQVAFPLKASANKRYLVDQNNAPFLMMGDSPQSLFVNLSLTDAETYFANRAAKGFNTLWVNLLCADGTGGRSDATTYDGIAPFTTPGDLSTPNEAYFARMDAMLSLAASYGINIVLNPAETISFLSVLTSNGATKARNYGRYLGARYANQPNIIWMEGNDYVNNHLPSSAQDDVVTAVALGIKDNDTNHIHTVELFYDDSGSLDDASRWSSIISLDASYTYMYANGLGYPTYLRILTEYNRASIPVFLAEASYEYAQYGPTSLGTPYILRLQEYWTNLSGATGQLWGSDPLWRLQTGWQTALDSPGSVQFSYAVQLFSSRKWYNIVPDQTHAVVTAGYGTSGQRNYATTAPTADGTLVMAYAPVSTTLTVDMTKLSSVAVARWYDPSAGTFTAISGSPFANSGTHNFATPGNN